MKRIDLTDVLFIVGLAAVGIGVGMLSIPAALITVGILLMAVGLYAAIFSTSRIKED